MKNVRSQFLLLAFCLSGLTMQAQVWEYPSANNASFSGTVTSSGSSAGITINKVAPGAQSPQLKFQSNANDGLIIGNAGSFNQAFFNHSFPTATDLLFQLRGSDALTLNYNGSLHNATFGGAVVSNGAAAGIVINKVASGAQSPQLKFQSNSTDGLVIGNTNYFTQAFFNHSYSGATELSFQIRSSSCLSLTYDGSSYGASLPGTLKIGQFNGSTPVAPASGYSLNVAGRVRSNEIVVNVDGGADFVFENEYKIMPLSVLENYVKTNKHLPEIAPASQMQEEGVAVGEMQIKLLQKVEELTLYIIELKKEIESLKEIKR